MTWISFSGIGRGIALLMMARRQPKTSESGLMQARRNSAPWMVTSPWSEKSIPWCSLTVITSENPSLIAMNRAMNATMPMIRLRSDRRERFRSVLRRTPGHNQ